MSEFKNLIAIADDFSSESKCAIANAAGFAKRDGSELLLIHVLDGKSDKTDEQIKNMLAAECDRIEGEYAVNARYATPEGSIFKDIAETVKNEKAKLLVMGTHGIKSLGERLLGSWALRVVDSSPVPTLVVQNQMPKAAGYQKVLMEIDDSPECKILVKYAILMHKTFKSEIVFYVNRADDTYRENQVNHNVQFCTALLQEAGVPFVVSEQKSSGGFYKDLVRFAAEIYADVILIIANNNKTFADYLTEPEQRVIYNDAQIPVLCVLPFQIYKEENFSFSGLNF